MQSERIQRTSKFEARLVIDGDEDLAMRCLSSTGSHARSANREMKTSLENFLQQFPWRLVYTR